MIELTKINGQSFCLNCELIESLEEKPDTVITLFTGRKYIVKESIEEIIQKCIEFKNKAYCINGSLTKYEEWKREKSSLTENCGC
jgi:flagellar protein FlbD